MKTIKEIQEFNRRKILCAVHNTEDYEEALKEEVKSSYCLYLSASVADRNDIANHNFMIKEGYCWWNIFLKRDGDEFVIRSGEGYLGYREDFRNKILGRPLTLSRVLLALGGGMEAKTTIDSSPDKIPYLWIFNGQFRLLWDLTKETLEEQSEECQRAIFNLLGGK